MIDIRGYSLEDFIHEYLPAQQPRYGIEAVVLHHTYRPRTQDFAGPVTIEGVRRYHIHNNGWRDIGANCYTAPDGKVYNGRPLSWNNYAHAHISKSWSHVTPDIKQLAYPDRMYLNHHGFGIETIGDFDEEAIDPIPIQLHMSLEIAAAVLTQYGLPASRLFLHRDVAHKSCPGNRISRERARAEVAKRMENPSAELKVVLLPGSTLVRCNAVLEPNGVVTGDVRPLLEAVGYEVIADHLKTQRKLYVRAKDAAGGDVPGE